MKNTIALLLLVTLAFTACKDNPKNNAEDEAKKEQAEKQRKETEAKCLAVIKERLMTTTFSDSAYTLDSLMLTLVDTATEKTARKNFCNLLLNVKTSSDYYVEKQMDVVKSASKVSPMLAEPEKKRLEFAIKKQEIAKKNYNSCLDKLEAADNTTYNYFETTIVTISTQTRGKRSFTDTTEQKFYINRNSLELKLF